MSRSMRRSMQFENKNHQLLIKKPDEIQGQAFSLNNLNYCIVKLLDHCSTVSISNLKCCHVFVGACSGAINITGCDQCIFTVASRQLSVANCSNCTLYTYVESIPTVKSNKNILFSYYNGSYPGILHSFENAKLKYKNNMTNQLLKAVIDDNDIQMLLPDKLIDDETRKFTNFGKAKLNEAFRMFDNDLDGSLNLEELNCYQTATGSSNVVGSQEELMELFGKAQVKLNVNGNLSFTSFCELYKVQDIEELEHDLEAVGINVYSLPECCSPFAGYEPNIIDNSKFETILVSLGDCVNPVPYEDLININFIDSQHHQHQSTKKSSNNIISNEILFLLYEASKRGININQWMDHFDKNKTGKLSRDEFEQALSGLFLGLCVGDTKKFERIVEKALTMSSINTLVNLLKDPTHPNDIHYGLLTKMIDFDDCIYNVDEMLKHSSSDNPNNISRLSKPVVNVKCKPLTSELVKYINASSNNLENIRQALMTWRWCRSTLKPQVIADRDSEISNVISLMSLQKALLSVNIMTNHTEVKYFANIIRKESELIDEKKLCNECTELNNFLGYSKKIQSYRYLTITSIMRWLTRKTLHKSITRREWIQNKLSKSNHNKQNNINSLISAFDGNSAYIKTLSKLPLNEFKSLIQDYITSNNAASILPLWAVESEATNIASIWLSSEDGKSSIRKRIIHNKNEHEKFGDGSVLYASEQEAHNDAFKQVKEERIELLRKEMAGNMDNNIKYYKMYEKIIFQGSSLSFEDWLRSRASDRMKNKSTMKAWTANKQQEVSHHKAEVTYLGLVHNIESVVKAMVDKTLCQKTDARNGIVTNRSSRYAGLDIEIHLTKLRKRSAVARKSLLETIPGSTHFKVRLHRENQENEDTGNRMDVYAKQALISHKEFIDEFKPLLTSLTADSRSASDAKAMLNPYKVACETVEAMLESAEGEYALDDAIEHLHEKYPKLKDNELKAKAKSQLISKSEKEIYFKYGFDLVNNDESLLNQSIMNDTKQRQSKANDEFHTWLKNKKKLQKKTKLLNKKQSINDKKLKKQRAKQAAKEFQKWKKAANKRMYYTAPSSKNGKKTLKKRPVVNDKPIKRPQWSYELNNTTIELSEVGSEPASEIVVEN